MYVFTGTDNGWIACNAVFLLCLHEDEMKIIMHGFMYAWKGESIILLSSLAGYLKRVYLKCFQ